MARNKAAPSGDYFADSEPSDLYLPPTRMHRTTSKPTKPRHVTVRSPSEEELVERTPGAGDGRTPKQHAVVHHSSSEEEEEPRSAKAHEQGKPETEGATAPPGVAPYNAPAGTTVQNGSNQVYLHGYPAQPGCLPGQPFFHTPCTYAINYPGQPAPFIITNPATMEDYQNAAPNNGGLNFQPQVPDTSLGPMIHTYRPSYDGGVVYAQPGIAVCQPLPPYLVSSPLISHNLTLYTQPARPMTFAPAPLVAMPAAVPTIAVCQNFVASAPVYTTLGHMGEDEVVAPREVVAVRRVSTSPKRLSFCSQMRYIWANMLTWTLVFRDLKVSQSPSKAVLPPPPSCPSSRSSPTSSSR